MAKRKPAKIEAGKCYRMNRFGRRSDVVVYVYAIEGAKQRWCMLKAVSPGHALGYNADSYTSFLRRVHSEEPTARN